MRDMLMGREPKDCDFATNALPDQTMDLLRRNGVRVVETGAGWTLWPRGHYLAASIFHFYLYSAGLLHFRFYL